MTIKSIKEKYNGKYGNGEKTMFTVYDYKDGNGKMKKQSLFKAIYTDVFSA